MAKKLTPLERQIYERINVEIYEKANETFKKNLRKLRSVKGTPSIKNPNIAVIIKREQYKKLYRLSQTKFLHQSPNVVAQLRKDYERNYGTKLKFVARGKTNRPIPTEDKKIRKRLLSQKYYYTNKQRKIANQFNTAGFVSYEKWKPVESLEWQLHQLKRKADKLGGTRKLTNDQIKEQIKEIKKGVSANYYVNKQNFTSEEARMDAVIADFAQHLNDALKGRWSPELRILIDEQGSGWYNNSIMDVLKTIHRTEQVEIMSRFYGFEEKWLIERLSEVNLGYRWKKQQ